MNAGDIAVLSPLVAVAGTAVVVMLAAAYRRYAHRLAAGLTLTGLAVALGLLPVAWPLAPREITALLIIDHYALFYMGLILAAAFAVAMFSYDYLEKMGERALGQKHSGRLNSASGEAERARPRHGEHYALLLLATAGAVTLASSIHFASFFLGLELLSVSLYALVAYARAYSLSIEAGVKYLILSGAASAFLLFGMALVYADLGTMDFSRIAVATAAGHAHGLLPLAGAGLIVVGIGFKLSLAPFHLWAPDVYEGAPAPATAFIATVSKAAVFVLLLRFLPHSAGLGFDALTLIFTLIAVVSMFVGNWLALLQTNVKRLLAYSSIAHMGYLLVAFLASGSWASVAVAYYLWAYVITTLGAFGVVSVLSTQARDADAMDDYRGLAWRHPWVAGAFSGMILSLAGIPLTAGFVGKFYLLAAGMKSGLWLLVLALVASSAIGLFYYLRLIVTIFRPPIELASPAGELGAPTVFAVRLPPLSGAALFALTLALLWLGVYPDPAIRAIQAVMAAP